MVPYVLGREGVGMGAGPLVLHDAARTVWEPRRSMRIRLSEPFGNEVGACFDLNRQVARAVADARGRGAFPVVLTGNCHTQQAVAAGLGRPEELGLVWFDCHGDLHTPETTTSGFFDGCALSMTLGQCWTALCATVPGWTAPVREERVVFTGGRDLDAAETERLRASRITHIPETGIEGLGAALQAVGRRASLHLDLDILDPDTAGRANAYATPGGITAEALREAVEAVYRSTGVEAVTISAYDPAHDPEGRVRTALVRAFEA